MSDTTESPPRRRRRRWLVRLVFLLLLAVTALLGLDAAGRLPPGVQRACEDAGVCGRDILPGAPRATRLEFPIGAGPGAGQATRALVAAERRGDSWLMTLRIDALPGAARYSLIQVLATREGAPRGEAAVLSLHDSTGHPTANGRWEVTVTVPNEVFRNRDWVLRYRADTIDALAVSEDIAPHIRQAGAIR
ncbi:hypothetical protein EJV46_06400 [Roseococcus sp. SYP-B2431]|uniref:hypothetical protein n=1 Tax=Roseococcus sp. SYP-B2431 TaxID=2496640 RepID=UPI0010399DFF|nr:hypothetical protein [Roseococcus sp. SYP-B2431]TCI00264.1 hypothetical protein EJV46_06400 [Roseococcus sp. SYP-B2431]